MNRLRRHSAFAALFVAMFFPAARVVAQQQRLAAEEAARRSASRPLLDRLQQGIDELQALEFGGDIDRDYAALMRLQHRQAVEFAQLQLEHGQSDELKALARAVIRDHGRDLAQLDRWVQSRG